VPCSDPAHGHQIDLYEEEIALLDLLRTPPPTVHTSGAALGALTANAGECAR